MLMKVELEEPAEEVDAANDDEREPNRMTLGYEDRLLPQQSPPQAVPRYRRFQNPVSNQDEYTGLLDPS